MSKATHWSLRIGAALLLFAAAFWPRSRADAPRAPDPAVALRAAEAQRSPRVADTAGAAELRLSN